MTKSPTKLPTNLRANTPQGKTHVAELDTHAQQTKDYGGHPGLTDYGNQGTGYSTSGGLPGSGNGGAGASDGMGKANYTTNSAGTTPDCDAGPDAG